MQNKKIFYVLSLIIANLILCIILDISIGFIVLSQRAEKEDSYFHHGFKANFKSRIGEGNNSYTIYTNSLGLIDEYNRIIGLKKSKYRIMFIGDSFTEGIGVTYAKSFVGVIDKQLRRENIEVLNAAAVSYSPKLYYLKVKYLLERVGLEIDELIVYIDISDIQDEIVYRNFVPRTNLLASVTVKLKTLLRQRSLLFRVAREIISKYSWGFFRKGLWQNEPEFSRVRDLWPNDEHEYKKWGQEGLLLAEKHMDMLFQLCKQHGIKTVIAVYPWPTQIRLGDLNSKQVIFWREFSKRRNIAFIDYFPDFIKGSNQKEVVNRYFIAGEVHWNSDGHYLIAQKWLNFYKNRLMDFNK